MTTVTSTDAAPSPFRGIGLYMLALFLFVLMDSTAKYLSRDYPVPQIVWARYFFHLVLMTLLMAPKHGLGLVLTRRAPLQVFRSLLLMLATLCFFTAISFIPLADASAIAFVSPLVVVALSVVILKEKVGHRRWTAVGFGFLGAVIIVRPGLGAMHPASFLVLGMAFFFGLYQITTRLLSSTELPETTLFYTALIGALVMSCAVPFFWETPDLKGWLLMALVGLIGGVSQFALIKAFHLAPASTIAPFNYSQLIWTVTLGYLFFGDFPDGWTFVGAAIVAGSGLYVLYREHQLQRAGVTR